LHGSHYWLLSLLLGLEGGPMIIIDHLPEAPINHCYKQVFSLELHEYTLTIKTNNVSSYWGRCHVAIQWFI
jgi:hypothetical protein